MGKRLKIKSGRVVLVKREKVDRFPPRKEVGKREIRANKVSGKNENDNCLNCLYLFIYLFAVPIIPINLVYYYTNGVFRFLLIPALLSPIIPIYIHFKLRKTWRKKKRVMHLKAWQKEMHPIDWAKRERLLAEEQKRTASFYDNF